MNWTEQKAGTRANLLLHTTCNCSWCSWHASCKMAKKKKVWQVTLPFRSGSGQNSVPQKLQVSERKEWQKTSIALICLVVGGGGFRSSWGPQYTRNLFITQGRHLWGQTNFGPAQTRSRQGLPLVVNGFSCWVRSKRKRSCVYGDWYSQRRS